MKVNIDYKDTFYSIEQELLSMANILESEKKVIITKGTKIIKAAVVKNLPKSDLSSTATNYDGTPYIHMRNDVKTQIKDDKQGTIYGIIRGGKYTGYKWHMLENGTTDTVATHFIEKSMKETGEEIDNLVDIAIEKAVQ